MTRKEPPAFDGTFSGDLWDGRSARITLAQTHNALTGRGIVGGDAFSLSGIASWYSPVVLNFENGAVKTGYVSLSANGRKATFHGFGEQTVLERGGDPFTLPSGPFAGRYATNEIFRPASVWLDLTQHAELLAGTGYIRGRPVAVAGKITGTYQARGSLLFSDESRSRVTVTLSDDRRHLIVTGFGAPLRLHRQRQ